MLICITRRAKRKDRPQSLERRRLIAPLVGYPKTPFTSRNEETRILCGSIYSLFAYTMKHLLFGLGFLLLAVGGRAFAEDGPLFPVSKFGDGWRETGLEVGFIDQEGTLVMPLTKEYLPLNRNAAVDYFSEGLQPVQIGRGSKWPLLKWGYLNRTFSFAIEPAFEYACQFSEGVAAARINESPWNFGYINKQGDFVIPPQYEDAEVFSDGRAVVRVRGDRFWGVIDKEGRWVVNPKYPAFSHASNYSEGMACVSKRVNDTPKPGESEFLWGYIDKSGKQVIDFRFKDASSFKKGIAVVRVNEGYGYIDPSGEFVIPPKFRLAWEFSEGLARVTAERVRMAFIDRSGQVVFSVPDGGWADPFSEGLANVSIRGKDGEDRWGYIDQTGQFVISPEFRMAQPFRHGLAAATRGMETGYINKKGCFVWKTTIPSDLIPKRNQQNE